MVANNPLKIQIGIIAIVVVALSIMLFTCGHRDNLRDLRAYVDSSQNSIMQNKNKTTFTYTLPTPSTYLITNHRMPFEVKIVQTNVTGAKTAPPLNAYSLSILRFLGTIQENNQIKGIIMTPDGKIFQVKVGDTIGDHYDSIISVTSDKLEIRVSEPGSPPTQRTVTLQLKD